MAAFSVTRHRTKPGLAEDVLADMEAYLETKDSTTNVIYYIGVVHVGAQMIEGLILHAG